MNRRLALRVFGVGVWLAIALPAAAQWVSLPLPGTPRLADGKPNLNAPAPKTADGKPDLSGIWRAADGYLANIATGQADFPLQAWAAALYKERQENRGKERPSGRCLPHAVPDAMMVRTGPFKILQTTGVTMILFEEFNHYRQLFTDGRGFPKDPNPTWFGYSVGKWEGDTLVVESVGFNDQSWLDDPGHPHTDAMRVTEKFTRRNFGRLEIQITIDDPKAYTRPWTINARFDLLPDTELIENICENERDYEHLVDK
jgi:hypothetical protein